MTLRRILSATHDHALAVALAAAAVAVLAAEASRTLEGRT